MSLFVEGDFKLHSGRAAKWKIECDALTKEDWEALAVMVVERVPAFGEVEGVPRGGLPLAGALYPYVSNDGPLLIVDDVLTTGASMDQHRAGRDAIGVVVFARNVCPLPSWVTPLFSMTPPRPFRR